MDQFRRDEPSVFPAVLSCVAGIFGLATLAAGPWLLLTSSAPSFASEQRAVQAAEASPAMEESKRIFGEWQQRFEAGFQSGTPVEVRLAAGL